jgi:hypothetical protein
LDNRRIYSGREEYVDFMVLRLSTAVEVGNDGTDAFLRGSDEIDSSEMRGRLTRYSNVINNCIII